MEMVHEAPILFTDAMVRAILRREKTETRRVMKPQPRHHPPEGAIGAWSWKTGSKSSFGVATEREMRQVLPGFSPYGGPGDRLWVREPWATERRLDRLAPSEIGNAASVPLWYRCRESPAGPSELVKRGKWRPSIFMPRWASRILLEVTEVKVERVQEITEEAAKREGMRLTTDGWRWEADGPTFLTPRGAYATLWDELHSDPKPVRSRGEIVGYVSYPWTGMGGGGRRGKPWFVYGNPWVWVVRFRMVEGKV